MRFLPGLFLSVVSLVASQPEPKPALRQIQRVYLLPMANSLDQHLAERLTARGLVEVVTDPQRADAILTDNIGAGFEQKLEELYPPAEKAESEDDRKQDPFGKPMQRTGSLSRTRGTVFVVDRASRVVLWSVYRPVRGSRPEDTNRRADDIAGRLEKALRPK
jgi:hypothetical protein